MFGFETRTRELRGELDRDWRHRRESGAGAVEEGVEPVGSIHPGQEDPRGLTSGTPCPSHHRTPDTGQSQVVGSACVGPVPYFGVDTEGLGSRKVKSYVTESLVTRSTVETTLI